MRLFFFIIAFGIGNSFAQTVTKCGQQSNAIWNLVKRHHYDAKPLDDSLAANVATNFIQSIDPGGYYFLRADADELYSLQFTIDDNINAKSSDFFDRAAQLFSDRLKTADSIIAVLEKTPFDFRQPEVLSYAGEDYPDYVTDNAQLAQRWRKWLKYATLDELLWGDYFDDPFSESIETLLGKVEEAKKNVIADQRFEIKSYLDHPAGYENYLATYYLDALAGYFDPHTAYFSDIEKENFESDLSGENLVFGISVEADDKGVVRIASLLPGSPAWNSNELNKGDEILALELDGQRLEMTTAGVDEITMLFENSTGTQLTLEIRKLSGQEKKVEIQKGEVYLQDDVIKNVILSGSRTIGYITLPDFYTEWDNDGDLGCANDIAKTIVKLQQENIQGLILDLRNNGGGSLKEAIDLAGIFIDWGPLTVLRNKYGEMTTLKDMNKGAIYTGPLVVMVNGLSASASELFAAAMQDYNRAIIVGSPTYGKATSQVIYPVDPRYIPGMTDEKYIDPSFGYLKITIDKLYRVTNKTHQKTGVIPDILLPDIYDIYDYKEATEPNALASDSIVKTMYYTPFPEFPASLVAGSQARVAAHTRFIQLRALIDSLLIYETNDIIPLEIETYIASEKAYDQILEQLFDAGDFATSAFKATNNKYDMEILNMDAWRRELNAGYLQQVESDIFIEEAYYVLTDYLNTK